MGATQILGIIAGPLVTIATRLVDDHVRLQCKARARHDHERIKNIGCPSIEFTVASKGNRDAKISELLVSLRGYGFVEAMQAGFSESFGHETPSDPSLQEEELCIKCLPVDARSNAHGWVLGKDDVARFIFPVAIPVAPLLATSLCDNLCVKAVMFDDEETEILGGNDIQPLLQALLDYSTERQLESKAPHTIAIRGNSTVLPNGDLSGKLNDKPVTFQDQYPDSSDFDN